MKALARYAAVFALGGLTVLGGVRVLGSKGESAAAHAKAKCATITADGNQMIAAATKARDEDPMHITYNAPAVVIPSSYYYLVADNASCYSPTQVAQARQQIDLFNSQNSRSYR